MSNVNTVFKNTSWLFASQVISGILGFIWIVLITRYLGLTQYGILSTVIAYTSVTAVFLDLGLGTFSIREVSRDTTLSSKYLGNIILIKLILSLIIVPILILIMYFLGYNFLTLEVLFIIILQTVFNTLIIIFNSIVQANEKMEYTAIATILTSIVNIIGFLTAIYIDAGLLAIASIYSISALLTLCYLIITSYKIKIKPSFEIDLNFWKKTIKGALPFWIIAVLATIYYSTDTIMLSLLKGDSAVGIYNASYKIINLLITIYLVYRTVIFPVMSKFYNSSKELLQVTYERSVKYLLILAIPLAVGITIYSNEIMNLIYGSEFQVGASVLMILVWSMVLLFINELTSNLLNASNKEITVTTRNSIAAIANVVINLLLIPLYSYNGASISTLITQGILLILTVYILIKDVFVLGKNILIDIGKIILINSVLAIILYLLKLPLILAIIVGLIIYIIGIFITKLLDTTDKNIIKDIIKGL